LRAPFAACRVVWRAARSYSLKDGHSRTSGIRAPTGRRNKEGRSRTAPTKRQPCKLTGFPSEPSPCPRRGLGRGAAMIFATARCDCGAREIQTDLSRRSRGSRRPLLGQGEVRKGAARRITQALLQLGNSSKNTRAQSGRRATTDLTHPFPHEAGEGSEAERG
jgi:hypothetical protein